MSRRRALIAGLLAALYPGLGHVYLRAWLRALAWFGLAVLTAALVVPPDVITAYETGGLGALAEASRDLPTTALLALLLVRLLNVVDVVPLAFVSNRSQDTSAGASCPECGQEVDPQLDFCHWCTAKLDQPADGEAPAGQGKRFLR